MSGRYGRNQKRAHREAIDKWRAAYQMTDGLCKHLSSRLSVAQQQLKDVSDALGERFVGLDPVEAAYRAESIYAQDSFLLHVGDADLQMHALRVERLHRSDNPAHHLHFVAHVAGVRASYVISEPALADASEEFIVRQISRQMSRLLVEAIRSPERRP